MLQYLAKQKAKRWDSQGLNEKQLLDHLDFWTDFQTKSAGHWFAFKMNPNLDAAKMAKQIAEEIERLHQHRINVKYVATWVSPSAARYQQYKIRKYAKG